MSETVNLSLEEAEALSRKALSANGADEENARATTDIMMRAERDRCASHGLFRLEGYCKSLISGKVDGAARPTVTEQGPGAVRVDGNHGFAPLALEAALPAVAEKARSQGIAVVGITNIHHFAALWPEVETLADQNLCAIAVTQASPMVAPSGGKKRLFGTNPMAFAWPRPGNDHFVFDQASAAMARGEVMIHARDGHKVPLGTGIDEDGNPTEDPNEVLKGAQLAFGGYKGANIALMVELLAGGLIGSVFSYEAGRLDNKDGGPATGGEAIIAIDPSRLGGADWAAHCEGLFEELAAIPGTRLPGERRRKARQETPQTGIDLPAALHAKVVELSEA